MSDVFKNFWKKYQLSSSRKEIISNGEIKLSKVLIENNHNIKPAYDVDILNKIYLHQIFEFYPSYFYKDENFLEEHLKLCKTREVKGDIKIKYLDFFSHKHYKDFESYYYKINRHLIKSFESGSQIHKNYLIFLYDQFPCIKLDLLSRANLSADELSIIDKLFLDNQEFKKFKKLVLTHGNKDLSSLYKKALYKVGVI